MIIKRDVSIPTSDGLVLKADVFRPDEEQSESTSPVIMTMGPYGKGVEYKTGYTAQWNWLFKNRSDILAGSTKSYMAWETIDPEIWTSWGYAVIRVDSRGAGRSPGIIDIFSPREILDFYEAIEWAGVQEWCNGKVGLLGISYYAINQWLVSALQPPHLAAMIPWEGCSDMYRETYRHGGILSNTFNESWFAKQVITIQHGNTNGYQDPWLKEKSTGPETLAEEELQANRVIPIQNPLARHLLDDWYRERSPDWSRVVTPLLSSANLAGFGLHGRGNFEGFTRAASRQKWLEVHPGRHDEAFYLDHSIQLQKRFLDYFLKDVKNDWDQEPPVLLRIRRPSQALGEVRKEQAWPLPSTQWRKMYLQAADKTLMASEAIQGSSLTFDAATSQDVLFQSEPLPIETEITGPIAVKLFISSSTTDADLFLTFQAFSPEGIEVEFQGAWDPHTPLSMGWLRSSHRKLDPTMTKPYRPYHSHDEIQPLEPGSIYELDVEVWPTSITLPAGYTIGLRVGGRDFQRPEALNDDSLTWREKGAGPFLHNHPDDRGSPTYAGKTTIYSGIRTNSHILLPIIPS
ncbi:uncharacterized protein TRUGW13939_10300 [Talaromyces rugulosus]|uniref:Xaa-Pro dipeptidyl-peptidase C-terminal domain-containing protein n=1 Tax=Talaromyces rugulosus TaxID=121627 RepID=A0A7H8R9U9_TALRU|nr:uncharacterized protein TRUGW13939_10300 [Talaromyces rugulosus]QKX63132.1 hypothetical protein TRUGW13939_10300 [Talaromyces rugulosus]